MFLNFWKKYFKTFYIYALGTQIFALVTQLKACRTFRQRRRHELKCGYAECEAQRAKRGFLEKGK